MPLIDVVFLLLTFFIYAIALMVQAEVLPFELADVTGGQRPETAKLQILAIGPRGEYIWDGQVLTSDQLDQRLTALGSADDNTAADTDEVLFITMAAEGLPAPAGTTDPNDPTADQPPIDRGPVMFDLMQRLKQAGVERWSLVGLPDGGAP